MVQNEPLFLFKEKNIQQINKNIERLYGDNIDAYEKDMLRESAIKELNDINTFYKDNPDVNVSDWYTRTDDVNDILYNTIVPYDTGGYTGDWGSASGRLAVLHEKELVLNKKDTANILSAVSAIRSISGLDNSINDAMMKGISRMMLEMTGLKAHANYNTQTTQSTGDTIYEIHAEFPDANDVNSIREAILSLPNLASQRTLRY